MMPDLELKLRQAQMADTPVYFIKKTIMLSNYMTFGLIVIAFGFLGKSEDKTLLLFFLGMAPVMFVIMFFYFIHAPDVHISKRQKAISREVVFAGRFFIIEIKSGVNLYDAMLNVSRNFPEVGRSFNNITTKIDFGTTIDEAINEEIENTTCPHIQKILWQILNSLKTGADISQSLESVLNQIVRIQTIEVSEYGKKLNPLAMFYMMIAVILPSIGIAMFIVLSSFIALDIGLGVLMIIAMFLGFMQFMFIAMIKGQRPAVEL